MGKAKRAIDEIDAYESDGGFVSNDDGKAVKSKKKAKTTTSSASNGKSAFWSVRIANHIESPGLIPIRSYQLEDSRAGSRSRNSKAQS